MTALPVSPDTPALAEPDVVPVTTRDGARFELLLLAPASSPRHVLYWLPALGVPAKHYLPLATALAADGVAVVLHEWRGIGSSDRRAGRRCDWGYRELLEVDLPAGLAAARARWPQAVFHIGGHSLGGQVSCLYAALHPTAFAGIVLVASGAPYWRRFRRGAAIGSAYVLAPWLARLCGHLPGRRIGFGGNEARGVIADWARSGRSGRYAAAGMTVDFEQRLSELQQPVMALRLRDDWFGPSASLEWLLGKMPRSTHEVGVIEPADLAGHPADHFTWMKTPAEIAARIAHWVDRRNTAFATPNPHSS
ncbi:alpha/beta fold hydrolase [Rhodanobacter glycinis]|uniref:Alpha/beta fold hydrolase n=1 Tax=Rhodanobacter glycinis TaxID=582702 RepID=A0A5B9E226_9GAMM|nr:alpha/beta fold hydrolase [Rhodanobacter glycinis]QEE24326.1 alpha/beta fold hydrolase [Rhodanobacter glycinis]